MAGIRWGLRDQRSLELSDLLQSFAPLLRIFLSMVGRVWVVVKVQQLGLNGRRHAGIVFGGEFVEPKRVCVVIEAVDARRRDVARIVVFIGQSQSLGALRIKFVTVLLNGAIETGHKELLTARGGNLELQSP